MKDLLWSYLRKYLLDFVVKAIGSPVGLKGKAVILAVKELLKRVVKPVYYWITRKINKTRKSAKRKIHNKKVANAKDENDWIDTLNSSDDI